MIDGARIPQLTSDTLQPITNYKDCLTRIICNQPSINCHLKKCDCCTGTSKLMEQLQDLFDEEFQDTVTFRQWVSVDRTNLEIIQLELIT